jgi:hypothetical protein
MFPATTILMALKPSAVTVGGLLLDIVGAVVLAFGFIFRKPSKAVAEATPMWDYNVSLDASLAAQTADAQVGAALLVLGFAVQMLAALGWHRNSSWSAVALAIPSAATLDALALLFLFKYWRPTRSAKCSTHDWNQLTTAAGGQHSPRTAIPSRSRLIVSSPVRRRLRISASMFSARKDGAH